MSKASKQRTASSEQPGTLTLTPGEGALLNFILESVGGIGAPRGLAESIHTKLLSSTWASRRKFKVKPVAHIEFEEVKTKKNKSR